MRFLACPGQGSQTPGFLKTWLEQIPGFGKQLLELSQACGKDLEFLGTVADEDTIKDTANSQPLIVGASIAAYRASLSGVRFDGVVGHSVGEFAAAAIAGVISDTEAMRLVAVRANAMALAAALEPSSMAAVLGGEESEVMQSIAASGLTPANYNGAGQLVAAGSKAAVAHLIENPPAKSRVIELKVAGAFHSTYMSTAETALLEATESIMPLNPIMTLLSNRDGLPMAAGSDFLVQLVLQISRPVRWDMCMESMTAKGAQLVELPPAGALAGLAKRAMAYTTHVALKTPDDIAKIEA